MAPSSANLDAMALLSPRAKAVLIEISSSSRALQSISPTV
jgi:hypothetical protein